MAQLKERQDELNKLAIEQAIIVMQAQGMSEEQIQAIVSQGNGLAAEVAAAAGLSGD